MYLNFLPQGFKLKDWEADYTFNIRTYEKDNMRFTITKTISKEAPENEETEDTTHIEINGNDCLLSEISEDTIILSWSANDNLYTLRGEKMERETLIKIAENIDLY